MSKLSVMTRSVDETRALGTALAELLVPGTVVVLIGGLGAGKTACAQGIATGLGVSVRVTSPTFTMVATYPTDGRRGVISYLHADLYRVSSGAEADDLAIGELVEDSAIAAVEWGDLAPDVLGPRRVEVSLALDDGDDDRIVTVASDLLDEAALRSALAPWAAR